MKKKVKWSETDKYFMPKGEVYLATFSKYFSGENFNNRIILNMRSYTVGTSNISYRVINHWDKAGLLPQCLKDGAGWRKFSLVEMVWLKIIQRFREYGFSLDKIARVKKSLVDWDKKLNAYPDLEYYIYRAWFTTDDPYVIALADGVAGIASSEEIEQAKMLHRKNNDFLLISIKSILNDLDTNVAPPKPLMWLTNPETEAISAIRGKNDEVIIKVKNQKISEIEKSKIYHENPPVGEINRNLKQKGSFGEINVKYGNGIRQSAKVTEKKSFK